jgi:hypothetical protein
MSRHYQTSHRRGVNNRAWVDDRAMDKQQRQANTKILHGIDSLINKLFGSTVM